MTNEKPDTPQRESCDEPRLGRFREWHAADRVVRFVEIISYTAMSMDGRIASAENELGFLETLAGSGPDDFGSFIADIDAVLVGAGTLRWLAAQGQGWPISSAVSPSPSGSARLGA